MKHSVTFAERDDRIWLNLSITSADAELEAIASLGNYLIADLTPSSFRKQYAEAEAQDEQIEALRSELAALPLFGSKEIRAEIREELAQTEREFDGLPTPHPYWLLKAADLAQHPKLELPYLEYAEAKKAETDFTRALSAFEKRLAPLIPEPAKEPEPLEPGPTTPEIEEQDWYSHCLLLARTRGGKTNAIRWRIRQLLPQIAEGRASLILMEPKGPLIDDVLHLRATWKIRDRVVIIDPRDIRVSVNIFDRGNGSDQAINEAVERISRIFGTITADLTPMQRTPLTFAIRAMFAVQGPVTMATLKQILREGIDNLSLGPLQPTVQEYFDKDFKRARADGRSGTVDGRATEILARINGLLANPVFEALFSGECTTFDLLAQIQKGKLILINASPRSVGGNAELFGRFWIEQALKTVWPRLDMPERERIPTTFVIDEAQTYVARDQHLADILDTAAESKLGLLLAMHHTGQIEDGRVKGSIFTNTTLKFAANTSEDIHTLCRQMGNCDSSFIAGLPRFLFAYYGPNMEKPLKVRFPHTVFDRMPRMSDAEYAELRDMSRKNYGYSQVQENAPPAEDPAAEDPPSALLRRRTTKRW